MNKNETIALCVGIITFALTLIIVITVVRLDSTDRLRACVDSGASYSMVDNSSSAMECVQP